MAKTKTEVFWLTLDKEGEDILLWKGKAKPYWGIACSCGEKLYGWRTKTNTSEDDAAYLIDAAKEFYVPVLPRPGEAIRYERVTQAVERVKKPKCQKKQ